MRSLLPLVLATAMITGSAMAQDNPPASNDTPATTNPPVITNAPATTNPPVITNAPATTNPPVITTAPAVNPPPASEGTGTGTGSSNDAVNPSGNAPSDVNASGTVNVVDPSALENGANSFTEGQAKSRIEGAGFTNVSDLKKDDQGIWRGTASRNGKSVSVGFDYKGNIAAK